MLKYLLIIAPAVLIILLPELSFSAPADAATVSEKLCELRRMLCGGGAGFGIVIIVIVGIGFMIFIGKINWVFVFIMGACMIFYFSADQITTTVLGIEEVDCPCNE